MTKTEMPEGDKFRPQEYYYPEVIECNSERRTYRALGHKHGLHIKGNKQRYVRQDLVTQADTVDAKTIKAEINSYLFGEPDAIGWEDAIDYITRNYTLTKRK